MIKICLDDPQVKAINFRFYNCLPRYFWSVWFFHIIPLKIEDTKTLQLISDVKEIVKYKGVQLHWDFWHFINTGEAKGFLTVEQIEREKIQKNRCLTLSELNLLCKSFYAFNLIIPKNLFNINI